MKKLFLLLPVLLLLFGLGLTQVALAEICSPGLCCDKIMGCGTGVSTKSATDCQADEICCYSASVTPLAQCNLSGVGKQICSGTCQAKCLKGQTETKTTDCTDQVMLCCLGKAEEPEPSTPSGDCTSGGCGGQTVDIKPGDLSPGGDIGIAELIGIIVKGALGIVGSIALLMFVYGGYMMLISQGDATKITKGKGIMVWATIGLLIIFGSYIFVSFVLTELNQ